MSQSPFPVSLKKDSDDKDQFTLASAIALTREIFGKVASSSPFADKISTIEEDWSEGNGIGRFRLSVPGFREPIVLSFSVTPSCANFIVRVPPGIQFPVTTFAKEIGFGSEIERLFREHVQSMDGPPPDADADEKPDPTQEPQNDAHQSGDGASKPSPTATTSQPPPAVETTGRKTRDLTQLEPPTPPQPQTADEETQTEPPSAPTLPPAEPPRPKQRSDGKPPRDYVPRDWKRIVFATLFATLVTAVVGAYILWSMKVLTDKNVVVGSDILLGIFIVLAVFGTAYRILEKIQIRLENRRMRSRPRRIRAAIGNIGRYLKEAARHFGNTAREIGRVIPSVIAVVGITGFLAWFVIIRKWSDHDSTVSWAIVMIAAAGVAAFIVFGWARTFDWRRFMRPLTDLICVLCSRDRWKHWFARMRRKQSAPTVDKKPAWPTCIELTPPVQKTARRRKRIATIAILAIALMSGCIVANVIAGDSHPMIAMSCDAIMALLLLAAAIGIIALIVLAAKYIVRRCIRLGKTVIDWFRMARRKRVKQSPIITPPPAPRPQPTPTRAVALSYTYDVRPKPSRPKDSMVRLALGTAACVALIIAAAVVVTTMNGKRDLENKLAQMKRQQQQTKAAPPATSANATPPAVPANPEPIKQAGGEESSKAEGAQASPKDSKQATGSERKGIRDLGEIIRSEKTATTQAPTDNPTQKGQRKGAAMAEDRPPAEKNTAPRKSLSAQQTIQGIIASAAARAHKH